jgi:hypothetical protein
MPCLCPHFWGSGRVEESRMVMPLHVQVGLKPLNGLFDGHALARVPVIGGLGRVEESCEGYAPILFCFDACATFCGLFLGLCPMFNGHGHLLAHRGF